MPDNNSESSLAITKQGIVLHRLGPQADATSIEIYSPLRGYWDILVKHRLLILSVTFVVTALVALHSFMTTPQYRAVARIVVEPEVSTVQQLNNPQANASPANEDSEFLTTQLDILRSDTLAWQTIQQLGLAKTPDFGGPARGHDSSSFHTNSQSQLVRAFSGRLSVERQRDTRMVQVGFESADPQLAARVVNALVQNYIEYNFRMKYDAARQTTEWMAQQLDELKNKVQQSQQALVDYERQYSIVNVNDNESVESVAEQKLADLSHDLTEAQNIRMAKESVFDLARSSKPDVGLVTQNDLLQKLEARDAELRQQYVEALQQYGEAFPKVVRIRAQMDEIRALIDRGRKRTVEQLHTDLLAAKTRENLLANSVAHQKSEVQRLNGLLIEHNILKREFDSNQQLYSGLLQRLKDATVSAGLKATNIHMVDPATPEAFPSRPKKLRNSLFGLLGGLMLGFVAAMVKELVDNSVKSAVEVEQLITAPVLAIIPSHDHLRPSSGSNGHLPSELNSSAKPPPEFPRFEIPRLNGNKQRVELAALVEPRSAVSEAFRALRTSILLSSASAPPRSLLITSALANEGKTCVCLNLGITLAQKGCRVLMIDADFRRPSITGLLNMPNSEGLSQVLARMRESHDCIKQVDSNGNLWVLPAGPCPPMPSELLCSPGMQDLIEAQQDKFDHIIIDSPPVLLVTDAAILSRLVHGVAVVVENDATDRGALLRACRLIAVCGGRILGAILNKVDDHRDGYYGHYHRSGYYGGNSYYSYNSYASKKLDG